MAAFQQADLGFGEMWQHLPAIISAASKSPLGLASLVFFLLSLVALALFRRERWRVKSVIFLVLVIAGFGVLYASARVPAAVMPTGKIVDEGGNAVAGALVKIESEGVPPAAYTDSEGTYQFTNYSVRPGVGLRITVRAKGFNNYERNLPADSTGRFEEIRLKKIDEPPASTTVPQPKPPRAIDLMGKVLDADGNPVANAEVTIESEGSPLWKGTGFTDTDGYYRFPNYPLRPATGAKIIVRANGFKLFTRHLPPGSRGQIEEIHLTRAAAASARPPGGRFAARV